MSLSYKAAARAVEAAVEEAIRDAKQEEASRIDKNINIATYFEVRFRSYDCTDRLRYLRGILEHIDSLVIKGE